MVYNYFMINKFGERLKDLLTTRGITQHELSQKTKISESVISYWINGKKQPTADNIILVADFFNVTADYLLGRTE